MATVWSNGRFCNVKHKVQCKEATIRVSIASFLLGPREAIEPLAELVDGDHASVYVPTTYVFTLVGENNKEQKSYSVRGITRIKNLSK
ncbi:hypothetical protein OSB04_027636 [Centaurea solstitialis]|uniref:Isopenicillin N synthase-like Fe(2+) 2OG dioxygenase domain-containing protein n=1 Tax=Centaurea solstitialis TaxID=347529 RepID=A0AA38W713_9ASTR|nr:hypothetical protein OSB04_027636 [Centaurea solstitialis]